jgi:hypothetical protein
LLDAIPVLDPRIERNRVRAQASLVHASFERKGRLEEVERGHFVEAGS